MTVETIITVISGANFIGIAGLIYNALNVAWKDGKWKGEISTKVDSLTKSFDALKNNDFHDLKQSVTLAYEQTQNEIRETKEYWNKRFDKFNENVLELWKIKREE